MRACAAALSDISIQTWQHCCGFVSLYSSLMVQGTMRAALLRATSYADGCTATLLSPLVSTCTRHVVMHSLLDRTLVSFVTKPTLPLHLSRIARLLRLLHTPLDSVECSSSPDELCRCEGCSRSLLLVVSRRFAGWSHEMQMAPCSVLQVLKACHDVDGPRQFECCEEQALACWSSVTPNETSLLVRPCKPDTDGSVQLGSPPLAVASNFKHYNSLLILVLLLR
jgi:hypothetical protein